MNASKASKDECLNCRERLEIVSVKFKLSGVRMLTVCPNCAEASADEPARSESRRLFWADRARSSEASGSSLE